MTKNVGGADRVLRVIAGVAVIAAGLYFKSWWGAIGVVPLLTAAIGWCPAYLPFGLSTCAMRKA
jgi:sulfite exporter TauE/SafE